MENGAHQVQLGMGLVLHANWEQGVPDEPPDGASTMTWEPPSQILPSTRTVMGERGSRNGAASKRQISTPNHKLLKVVVKEAL